jgi:hypothetical protein
LQLRLELLANDRGGLGLVAEWPSWKMESDFREENAAEDR